MKAAQCTASKKPWLQCAILYNRYKNYTPFEAGGVMEKLRKASVLLK